MQQDIVLRIPRCTDMQIEACPDKLSELKELTFSDDHNVYKDEGVIETGKLICQLAVPGACPRVQCHEKSCRLLGLIQSQENESGFWMKLPCSQCIEVRKLSPITEAFVYGEDTKASS